MALKGDHDPYQDPLQVTQVGSLMCPAPSYKMKEFPSQSHGKWLIFRNFEDLNKTWCVVREAVLSGKLGATGALCGTLKYSPLRHGAGPKTTQRISVFTKKEDYIEVGMKVVKLEVVQHDIKYKKQEATSRGHYAHIKNYRITCMNIFWNSGNPYGSVIPRSGTVLCPPPSRSKDDLENDIWKINVVGGKDQQSCHGKWVIVSNYQNKPLLNVETLWDELKAEIENGDLPVIRMECPAPHDHDKASGMPEIHIFTSQTHIESVGLEVVSRVRHDIDYFGEGNVKTTLSWNDAQHLIPKSSKMLNEIVDFQSFLRYLEEIMKESCEFTMKQSAQKISRNISKAIHFLRSHFKNKYDDVLITILTYTFLNKQEPIEMRDLELLYHCFKEHRTKYLEKNNILHLQIYLLQLSIAESETRLIVESETRLIVESETRLIVESETRLIVESETRLIVEMMLKLDPPLDNELLDLYDSHCPLSHLKQSLDEKSQQVQSSSSAGIGNNSLKNILQKKNCQYKNIPREYDLNNNPDVRDLLEKLGLCKYYPKGLQLQDAQRISSKPSPKVDETLPTDANQLPDAILHQIMTYDSRCRAQMIQSHQTPVLESNDIGISPFDSLLAVIICSDDFLRQDLLSRLAKCQLSVPFILPDPFTKQLTIPLWAMRSIIKEWRCIEDNGKVIYNMHPIVSYKMPIVSFIRFGKHKKYSKSKILNEVIGDYSYMYAYDHFFHRDCPGGRHNILLGDGLVDMCWYLPGGKPNDILPDAVTFLNLHGDAREHVLQTKFLSQISSMCFVLLTEKDLEFDKQTTKTLEILSSRSSSGSVTILAELKNPVDDMLKRLQRNVPSVHFINLNKKNIPQLRGEILDKIVSISNKQSIEDASRLYFRSRAPSIFIDENDLLCKQGLRLAEKVTKNLSINSAPLQCNSLWKSWAAKDREQYQQRARRNIRVHEYAYEVLTSKQKDRKEQLKYIESLSPLMESFISSLLSCDEPTNKIIRNYFIQSLKLELNKLSSENLAQLHNEYQNALQALRYCREDYQSLMKKINDVQTSMNNSSLGLKHLLRELGQMYESVVTVKPNGYNVQDVSRLPKAVAKLLIDGWPLEVMDGDAAHVPLQWVTAVLQEAAKMLGDPKVFVVSVLGLQSSGKSTMLNTLFGLQFNVSAGRCTRGAFMQLLPLDQELREETNCSYVLVVDTEGLRDFSLDPLESLRHNNELATFVIGLANMTLINIYGEVPGDMDDILQTSVHAFLRMKEVNLSPSCQFVHQNVGGNIKTDVGIFKFVQKLNNYICLAARAEHREEEYKCFNDVIRFNDQTDVHFFPALWKGDPPMAPVNQGYSIAAQELKHHFIENLKQGSMSTYKLNLSHLPAKINDLWISLLKEDFVLSFKNTLEFIAYKKLETEWSSKWRWLFQEKMLKWEQQAENEITATEDTLSLVSKKCEELGEYTSSTLQEIKKEMDDFIDRHQDETYLRMKPRFQDMLDKLASDLQQHAHEHCIQLGRSRTIILRYERKHREITEMIRKNIYEYVSKRGQHTEEDFRAEFDALWNEVLTKLVPSQHQEPVNVEIEVQKALLDFREDYKSQLTEKLAKQQLRNWRRIAGSPHLPHDVQNIMQTIVAKAKAEIENIVSEKCDFKSIFVSNILQFVDNEIFMFEVFTNGFTFKVEHRLDIFLTVCGYAVTEFEKMARAFRHQADPQPYLFNMKNILFIQFKNWCFQVALEEAVANTLCGSLEQPIKEQVESALGTIMVGQMKSSEYQYFKSKMALKAEVLTDLLDEDRFEHFLAYLHDAKKCLEDRMTSYVVKYCDTVISGEKTRLQIAAQTEINNLVMIIKGKVSEINTTNLQNWLSTFCEDDKLRKQLALKLKPNEVLDDHDPHHQLNLEYFHESIFNRLEKLKEKLHIVFNNITCEGEMDKWKENLLEIMTDSVGCPEQCPFCGEPCDLLCYHAGDHRAAIHRPSIMYRNEASQRMETHTCPVLISGYMMFKNKQTKQRPVPYKKYRDVYPNWHIIPDHSPEDCLYWKWFVAKYKEKLAIEYSAKPPEVPAQWLEIRKEDLITYLKRVYL